MEPVETPRGGVSGFSIPTQNSDRRQGSSMPKEPRMFNETPPVSIETPPSIETSIETPPRGVSTQPGSKSPPKNWAPGSLGTIINQFKMSCTKRIRNEASPNSPGNPVITTGSFVHQRNLRRYGSTSGPILNIGPKKQFRGMRMGMRGGCRRRLYVERCARIAESNDSGLPVLANS